MGWLNIYAATYSEEHKSIVDFSQSYGRQAMWIVTSLILATVVLMLEARFFSRFAYVIYGATCLLLALVLVIGSEIKGAKSWIVIGGIFSLQPSEFAKFGTAIVMSKYLSNLEVRITQFESRLKALMFIAIPCGLIMLQPDAGSTLVYASFVFVLYREGMSGNVLLLGLVSAVLFILTLILKQTSVTMLFTDIELNGKYVLMLVIALITGGVYLIVKKQSQKVKWLLLTAFIASISFIFSVDYVFDNVFKEHHRNRINELLGIISDPRGTGYNQHQSKIAIGSGGLSGKGFLKGTQTKFDFVPEQSTDFIFCTVGEEWGFLGSFVVIVLFLVFLFRIILVSERQRSKFARLYGYSVASILFFHFTINIAMTIGLAPVIGIPLPFFSYGGSSLWGFTILIFTFIKLDSERMQVLR